VRGVGEGFDELARRLASVCLEKDGDAYDVGHDAGDKHDTLHASGPSESRELGTSNE
jgi:hypothetical protein